MKPVFFSSVVLSTVLVGCSPETQKKPELATAAVTAPPLPKVLLPLYADASTCLAECISKWYRVPKSSTMTPLDFSPKLPDRFADLMANPAEHDRFVAMIEQLPPELHSIGKLGPDDEEKTVTSDFGSYKQERPALYGNLGNVIADKERMVYVYSGVYYMRFNKPPGSLHVAIDPKTKEYAGILRGGHSLEEYYVVGSKSLRSTLLAYTVASDLETADMLAHYARNTSGSYETKPVILPFNKNRDAANERVELLNDRLGAGSEALGISAPAILQEANAARAANAWYGVSQGRDKCIESPMSPADRIDVIKSSGITPLIRESRSGGQLSAVEVSADDGRYETTWKFFKSKAECERIMVPPPTPDKYR